MKEDKQNAQLMGKAVGNMIEQLTDTYIFLSCIFCPIVVFMLQGITWFNFLLYLIAILTFQRYYFKFKQLQNEKTTKNN